jgi:hypothetical protein
MMHRDERRNSTSRCVRETKAEAVAFAICQAIGLQTGSAARETTLALVNWLLVRRARAHRLLGST